MNRLAKFFLFLFIASLFFAPSHSVFAQTPTASLSAITPTLAEFPTLFPTNTPIPQSDVEWPLLPPFDDLQPIASISSATTSAIEVVHPELLDEYCLDVPVIMYHHIEPLPIATLLGHAQLTVDSTIFEDQVKYLLEHKYTPISADDLAKALYGHEKLPEKSVLITIDDGYIDNYSYAFLIAKKYHVVMNFMIPTGLIGKPDYMTWDHLKEMNESPYAKLYNHTTSHAPLGLIGRDEIVKEVTTATQQFTENLGIHPTILAYPYGSYSDLAIDTLKELGITAAISTDPGRNECTSNLMKLPRVRVGNAPLSEYGF